MSQEDIDNLGPLKILAGIWEGDKGIDTAPDKTLAAADRPFREHIEFTPIGQVDNHTQSMWGLRYSTVAWPEGKDDPFHEETGYWLWDPKRKMIMRCFIVPRGITVLAGGEAEENTKELNMAADVGSETFGICSNPFLDKQFKTVRYELKLNIHDDNSFSYFEDTQIMMPSQKEIFHHTDKNTLTRVK